MLIQYYKEGYDAYDPESTTANPYTPGSEPYKSWMAGHDSAWYDDKFKDEK